MKDLPKHLFPVAMAVALLLDPISSKATVVFSPIDITTGTGATASQSTNYSSTVYLASNALNGALGDFTHTAAGDTSPWWSVDLGRDETFNQILLFNRGGGCCPQRLSDITVKVLDASDTVIYTSAVLNPGNSMSSPGVIPVDLPSAISGRKIIVSRDSTGISGGDEVLSLGEVRIGTFTEVLLPLGTNLTTAGIAAMTAEQAPTSASPPGGGVVSNAFDGNFGNFTHTNANLAVDATFRVDFGEEMLLESVSMFNRTSCCGERLRDLTVTVLDGNGTNVFTSALLNPQNQLGSPGQIDVDFAALNGGSPIVGKTVVITRAVDNINTGNSNDDRSVISFGELQIFGGSIVPNSLPFAISAVSYDPTSDSATITWNGRSGVTYAVDASDDLSVWEELADNLSSVDGSGTFTEQAIAAPDGRRFYRVREE